MTPHLTVIAKAPIAGRVKTRLCPPCTPQQAAGIARAALLDTLDEVRRVAERERACGRAVRLVLLFDGDPSAIVCPPTADLTADSPGSAGAQSTMTAGFEIVDQRGDGLGERLHNGFCDLGTGMIVGMESPDACRSLGTGLAALRRGTDVLAPALDGGYWAIGLCRPPDGVFVGIPMSTSHTRSAQLRRLHALGRPVTMLQMARDLDDADDLAAAAARPVAGGRRLPAAARQALGLDPGPGFELGHFSASRR